MYVERDLIGTDLFWIAAIKIIALQNWIFNYY